MSTDDSLLSRVIASITATGSQAAAAEATSGFDESSGGQTDDANGLDASVVETEGRSAQKSILSQAAASYARKPNGAESTIPTGFDPRAASLFEAVIEASFLVANADGVFDEAERQTFETVVHEACQNAVQRSEVSALVADLCDQLEEDGVSQRVKMIAGSVAEQEHQVEVLRIAAVMAHISGGVDESERALLVELAQAFELPADSVDAALDRAASVLES